jgi:hypothetical protein
MVVVSAGSLCAGTCDIPRGVSREYNVIEIDPSYAKARVHVREAKVSNTPCANPFGPIWRRALAISAAK